MKKLLYSTIALLMSGVMFTGCGDDSTNLFVDGEGDPFPKGPYIALQTNTGAFGDNTHTTYESKLINTPIKIGVKITSDINLKSTKMTVKYNSQSEVIIGTDSIFGSNTTTCNRDYIYVLPADKGTYTLTAYATDTDATTSTAKIVIIAVGPLADRNPGEVFSLKSTTGFSAYDLFNNEAITASAGAGNEADRDIEDLSSDATLSKSWRSRNGTEFVISGADGKLNSKVYTQFQSKEDVIAAWNATAGKSTTVTGIEEGKLIIAKATRGGQTYYYLITIDTVLDDTGSDDDYIGFQYRQ